MNYSDDYYDMNYSEDDCYGGWGGNCSDYQDNYDYEYYYYSGYSEYEDDDFNLSYWEEQYNDQDDTQPDFSNWEELEDWENWDESDWDAFEDQWQDEYALDMDEWYEAYGE